MFVALVRLYQPEGYTTSGDLFVDPAALDWQPVPYLEPEQCPGDGSAICRGCVHSWEIDHEVRTPSLI